MTDTTADILRKAKAHIGSPEMWYKGGHSANGTSGAIKGQPCCALGAICWVLQDGFSRDTPVFVKLLQATPLRRGVASFNDHPDTTHADIMALFDRAIAKAEAE